MDVSKNKAASHFFKRGEPFVWLAGAGLSAVLVMIAAILYIVAVNGLQVFWPAKIHEVTLRDGRVVMGELIQEKTSYQGTAQEQYKIGNRDLNGLDFTWIDTHEVESRSLPAEAMVLERIEYGNFYGYLSGLDLPVATGSARAEDLKQSFDEALAIVHEQWAVIEEHRDQLDSANRQVVSYGRDVRDFDDQNEVRRLKDKALELQGVIEAKEHDLAAYKAVFRAADGQTKAIELMEIVRYQQPNSMGLFEKLAYNAVKTKELLFADPRESNTEGGLFPAIFGTVLLIIIMSICSFPLGVLAGIYLKEYAKEGMMVRFVRIAVNNLAGIPSIVYGIFGLGFFVYGVGASIDQIFYADRLPEPVFGTGGILWASLTLGLLTIPVVIVATEEALSAVPQAVRENSYALGATKFQTLCRVSLPAASGGILTGFILSMARAAGEVAPLMITGVVKMAPTLAIDGHFPYFHLERKFMHLGFHIYDISCQSPNVEAAKPMVYVSTLLLIVLVLALSGLAIYMRERIKRKYQVQSI